MIKIYEYVDTTGRGEGLPSNSSGYAAPSPVSKDYINNEFAKIANSVFSEAELFQKAFGDDYQKYYMPFSFRDKAHWEHESLAPAKFFIKSILDFEKEYGKIDRIARPWFGDRTLRCFSGDKMALITPHDNKMEIVD